MIQLWPDCGLVYLVWLGTGHYYGKRGVYKTRGLGGGGKLSFTSTKRGVEKVLSMLKGRGEGAQNVSIPRTKRGGGGFT